MSKANGSRIGTEVNENLSAGQVWYRKIYLKTDHWREIRAAKFKAHPYCYVCESREHLDVHHASYENLWHERPYELVVLCRKCHQREHSDLSEGEKIRIAKALMRRAEQAKFELRKRKRNERRRKPSKHFVEYAFRCLGRIRAGLATQREYRFVRDHHHEIARLTI